MFSTNEQKLQEIKALMLPVMRKELGAKAYGLTDDQIFSPQIPSYTKLFDMNMKWSFRLIKPDIPKEVREIEHQIKQLKVSRDMLELDKEYVLNKLKRMLRKFSESSLTRYIQLKHEVEKRTTEPTMLEETTTPESESSQITSPKQLIYHDKMINFWAENFFNENNELSPSIADFWNNNYRIIYLEQKPDDIKLKMLKDNYFDELKANSDTILSNEELENKWKEARKSKEDSIKSINQRIKRFNQREVPNSVREINKAIMELRLSREFYEIFSTEEAARLFKKAVDPYSDKDLLMWDSLFSNVVYTDRDTPFGKRTQIIFENTKFYHQRYKTWTPRFKDASSSKRKMECDDTKTVDELMDRIKGLSIQNEEAWRNQKKSSQEADEFWEKEKPNERKLVEECQAQIKKFKNVGQRLYQLYQDIEDLRLSKAFYWANFEKKLKMYTDAAAKYTDEEVITFWNTL
ncbi:hypothetical protein WR25_08908 [Diploscapter pachys]|uniref:Uncharacterized protein n=1 Tax=Diploscapter pachys TaxID=2018661 RepID=A0A2A2KN96_9BILA|nr:hypothetical protein WR25_08908 [Diploscapter pachys]